MNRIHQLNRFLAGLVAVAFFTTSTLTPAPLAHAQSVESPSFVSSFKIPEVFGKVSEILPAMPASPVLIHIQEAHANYDAQKNIRNILQHLNKHYGVNLILMEGAGYKLTPEIFNFFPGDAALQQKANDKLMQAGELTGAEVFLIDQRQETTDPRQKAGLGLKSAEAYGVENAKAYREGREAYRQVYQGRKTTESFLTDFYLQWQKSADRTLGKSLREFLDREISFEERRLPLQDWMVFLKTIATRELKIDLDDVLAQKDWPVLVRYFRLKKIDSQIDPVKVEKEKAAFSNVLATYGAKIPEAVRRDVASVFERAKKSDLPLYETRFVFERMMEALPSDFSFEAYPVLRLYIQQLILLSEIQSESLHQEISALTQKIVTALAKTGEEQKMVGLLQDYRLTKKLFTLELNREEYQQVKTREISPEKLLTGLQTSDQRQETHSTGLKSQASSLESLFAAAVDFYQTAIAREDFMMKNTLRRMQETKQTKAVLITGGFHTEGFKKQITDSGSAYISITPAIGEITPDSQKNYLAAFLGTDAVSKSQQAQLVRSDVRFLFDVSGRRELSREGARISQIVGPEGREAVHRNFVAAATGLVVRSESRDIHRSFERIKDLAWALLDQKADFKAVLVQGKEPLFSSAVIGSRDSRKNWNVAEGKLQEAMLPLEGKNDFEIALDFSSPVAELRVVAHKLRSEMRPEVVLEEYPEEQQGAATLGDLVKAILKRNEFQKIDAQRVKISKVQFNPGDVPAAFLAQGSTRFGLGDQAVPLDELDSLLIKVFKTNSAALFERVFWEVEINTKTEISHEVAPALGKPGKKIFLKKPAVPVPQVAPSAASAHKPEAVTPKFVKKAALKDKSKVLLPKLPQVATKAAAVKKASKERSLARAAVLIWGAVAVLSIGLLSAYLWTKKAGKTEAPAMQFTPLLEQPAAPRDSTTRSEARTLNLSAAFEAVQKAAFDLASQKQSVEIRILIDGLETNFRAKFQTWPEWEATRRSVFKGMEQLGEGFVFMIEAVPVGRGKQRLKIVASKVVTVEQASREAERSVLSQLVSVMSRRDPLPEKADIAMVFAFSGLAEAAKLYLEGVVPRILVSGRFHWGVQDYPGQGYGTYRGMKVFPEAHRYKEILIKYGIPAEAILVEDQSRDMDAKARNSLALLRAKKLIPVTAIVLHAALPTLRAAEEVQNTFKPFGTRVYAYASEIPEIPTEEKELTDFRSMTLKQIQKIENETPGIPEFNLIKRLQAQLLSVSELRGEARSEARRMPEARKAAILKAVAVPFWFAWVGLAYGLSWSLKAKEMLIFIAGFSVVDFLYRLWKLKASKNEAVWNEVLEEKSGRSEMRSQEERYEDARATLTTYGQEHVLQYWNELNSAEREELLEQAERVNWAQVAELYRTLVTEPAKEKEIDFSKAEPVTLTKPGNPEAIKAGEELLRTGAGSGKAAFGMILVAGGSGSRFLKAFPFAKGIFPQHPETGELYLPGETAAPLSHDTLFQIMIKKNLALAKRFGHDRIYPLIIMTSDVTNDATVAYFKKNNWFGMQDRIRIVKQRVLPVLERATGKAVLEKKHRISLQGGGHGDAFQDILKRQEVTAWLGTFGVQTMLFSNIDNPLYPFDVNWIGEHALFAREVKTGKRHLEPGLAIMSEGMINKIDPLKDTLSELCFYEGRRLVVRYNQAPAELRAKTTHAMPSFRIIELPLDGVDTIPMTREFKKWPDLSGKEIGVVKFEGPSDNQPSDGVAYEMVNRATFGSQKNPSGPESPETSRILASDLWKRKLQAAGHEVDPHVVVELPAEAEQSTPAELKNKLQAANFPEKLTAVYAGQPVRGYLVHDDWSWDAVPVFRSEGRKGNFEEFRGQSLVGHHLSQAALDFLREPDEKDGFIAARAREDERIRRQVVQIEKALGQDEESAQKKAQEAIDYLNANPGNFSGEEGHILDGVGKNAKVIGRVDRSIAIKFGYAHETVNIVLLTPDGQVLLQLRNKKATSYDDHLSMYGGYLGVGQSHEEGAAKHMLEEAGLSLGAGVFVGYEYYDRFEDRRKQRRSWYVKKMTAEEYKAFQEKTAQDELKLGIPKASVTRTEYKQALQKFWPQGEGEIVGAYAFPFQALETAARDKNSDSPFKDKNTRYLEVTDTFKEGPVTVKAFFTPDSLDGLFSPSNVKLWAAIKKKAGPFLVRGREGEPDAKKIDTWNEAFEAIRWVSQQKDIGQHIELIREISLRLRERKKELTLNRSRDYEQYPEDIAHEAFSAAMELLSQTKGQYRRPVKELLLALPYFFSESNTDLHYILWSFAADLDERLLGTKFARDLRQILHGPSFSYETLSLVRAYRDYLDTGSDRALREHRILLEDEDKALRDELAARSPEERRKNEVYQALRELEKALAVLFEGAHQEDVVAEWMKQGVVKNNPKLVNAMQSIFDAPAEDAFLKTQEIIAARRLILDLEEKEGNFVHLYHLYHLDKSLGQMMSISLSQFFDQWDRDGDKALREALELMPRLMNELFSSGFITRYTEQWADLLRDPELTFDQLKDVLNVMEREIRRELGKWTQNYEAAGTVLFGDDTTRKENVIAMIRKEKFATRAAVKLLEKVKETLEKKRAKDARAFLNPAEAQRLAREKEENPFGEIAHVDDFKNPSYDFRNRERKVYGGKGSYLMRMNALGLPVPSAFVIPAYVGKYDWQEKNKDLFHETLKEHMARLEKDWSVKRGTPVRYGQAPSALLGQDFEPMFLSVRSGAVFVMPGIFETAVSVGFTPEVLEYEIAKRGARPALSAYLTFIESMGVSLDVPREEFEKILHLAMKDKKLHNWGDLSEEDLRQIEQDMLRLLKNYKVLDEYEALYRDPAKQIEVLIGKVSDSWNAPRAKRYRREKNISDEWHTPVIVQAYVFGDRDENSGAGIALSHERQGGGKIFGGEWLPFAHGMTMMQGRLEPELLDALKQKIPTAYATLEADTMKLEDYFGVPQMIEFTIESGKAWILQTVHDQRVGHDESFPELDWEHIQEPKKIGEGNVAFGESGALRGFVVFEKADATRADIIERVKNDPALDAVVFASHFPSTDDSSEVISAHKVLRAVGKRLVLLTAKGGLTSHAAVVANYEEIPTLVSVQGLAIDKSRGVTMGGQHLEEEDTVTIDFGTGSIYLGSLPHRPAGSTSRSEMRKKSEPAKPQGARLVKPQSRRAQEFAAALKEKALIEKIAVDLRGNIRGDVDFLLDAIESRKNLFSFESSRSGQNRFQYRYIGEQIDETLRAAGLDEEAAESFYNENHKKICAALEATRAKERGDKLASEVALSPFEMFLAQMGRGFQRSEVRSGAEYLELYQDLYGKAMGQANRSKGLEASPEVIRGYDAALAIVNDPVLGEKERETAAKMLAYGKGDSFRGWQEMTPAQKLAMLRGWKVVGVSILEKQIRDAAYFGGFAFGTLTTMAFWWPAVEGLYHAYPQLLAYPLGTRVLGLVLSAALAAGILVLNHHSTARAEAKKQAAKEAAVTASKEQASKTPARSESRGASKLVLQAGMLALAMFLLPLRAKAQTVFPGKPKLEAYHADTGASGSIRQFNSSRFRWDYALQSEDRWTSVVINFMSGGGAKDLSGYGQFEFFMRGYNNRTTSNQGAMTVEFKDTDGDKATKWPVAGIYDDDFQSVVLSRAELQASNPNVNWDRIKEISFVVDSGFYMPSYSEGWFEIKTGGLYFTADVPPDALLTASDVTPLPAGTAGLPQPTVVYGSGASVATTATSTGLEITYNNGTQDWSGGGFTYDDFGTPQIETGDLSGFSNLVFAVSGDPATVKLEIVDYSGGQEHKEAVYLTQIDSTQRVWSVSTDLFAGVDLSQVRLIYFIMEGLGASGTLRVDDLAPVAILGFQKQGDHYDLRFRSPTGLVYQINASGALTGSWTTVQSGITTQAETTVAVQGPAAGAFYKVQTSVLMPLPVNTPVSGESSEPWLRANANPDFAFRVRRYLDGLQHSNLQAALEMINLKTSQTNVVMDTESGAFSYFTAYPRDISPDGQVIVHGYQDGGSANYLYIRQATDPGLYVRVAIPAPLESIRFNEDKTITVNGVYTYDRTGQQRSEARLTPETAWKVLRNMASLEKSLREAAGRAKHLEQRIFTAGIITVLGAGIAFRLLAELPEVPTALVGVLCAVTLAALTGLFTHATGSLLAEARRLERLSGIAQEIGGQEIAKPASVQIESSATRARSEMRKGAADEKPEEAKEIKKKVIHVEDAGQLFDRFFAGRKKVRGYDLLPRWVGYRVKSVDAGAGKATRLEMIPTDKEADESTKLVTRFVRNIPGLQEEQIEGVHPAFAKLSAANPSWGIKGFGKRGKRELVTIMDPKFDDLEAMVQTARKLVAWNGLIVVSLSARDMNAFMGYEAARSEISPANVERILPDFRLLRLRDRNASWPGNSAGGAFLFVHSPAGIGALESLTPGLPPRIQWEDVPLVAGNKEAAKQTVKRSELRDLIIFAAAILLFVSLPGFLHGHVLLPLRHYFKRLPEYILYRDAVAKLDPKDARDQQVLLVMRHILMKSSLPLVEVRDSHYQGRYNAWTLALKEARNATEVKYLLEALVLRDIRKGVPHATVYFSVTDLKYASLIGQIMKILEAGDSDLRLAAHLDKEACRWDVENLIDVKQAQKDSLIVHQALQESVSGMALDGPAALSLDRLAAEVEASPREALRAAKELRHEIFEFSAAGRDLAELIRLLEERVNGRDIYFEARDEAPRDLPAPGKAKGPKVLVAGTFAGNKEMERFVREKFPEAKVSGFESHQSAEFWKKMKPFPETDEEKEPHLAAAVKPATLKERLVVVDIDMMGSLPEWEKWAEEKGRALDAGQVNTPLILVTAKPQSPVVQMLAQKGLIAGVIEKPETVIVDWKGHSTLRFSEPEAQKLNDLLEEKLSQRSEARRESEASLEGLVTPEKLSQLAETWSEAGVSYSYLNELSEVMWATQRSPFEKLRRLTKQMYLVQNGLEAIVNSISGDNLDVVKKRIPAAIQVLTEVSRWMEKKELMERVVAALAQPEKKWAQLLFFAVQAASFSDLFEESDRQLFLNLKEAAIRETQRFREAHADVFKKEVRNEAYNDFWFDFDRQIAPEREADIMSLLETMAYDVFSENLKDPKLMEVGTTYDIYERETYWYYLERYIKSRATFTFKSTSELIVGYAYREADGPQHLVFFDHGGFGYSSPKAGEESKVWATVTGGPLWETMLGSSGTVQVVDAQTGIGYKTYAISDLIRNGLQVGISKKTRIHALKFVRLDGRQRVEIGRTGHPFVNALIGLIKGKPFLGERSYADYLREECSKAFQNPEELEALLQQVSFLSAATARDEFGGGVKAVMAFVTFLAPGLLEDMKSWDADYYLQLKSAIEHEGDQELFQNGTIQMDETDPHTGFSISRNFGKKNLTAAIHFAGHPYNNFDGKIRFRSLKPGVMQIQNTESSWYVVRDRIKQQMFGVRTGASFFRTDHLQGWQFGVDRRERSQFLEVTSFSEELKERVATAFADKGLSFSAETTDFSVKVLIRFGETGIPEVESALQEVLRGVKRDFPEMSGRITVIDQKDHGNQQTDLKGAKIVELDVFRSETRRMEPSLVLVVAVVLSGIPVAGDILVQFLKGREQVAEKLADKLSWEQLNSLTLLYATPGYWSGEQEALQLLMDALEDVLLENRIPVLFKPDASLELWHIGGVATLRKALTILEKKKTRSEMRPEPALEDKALETKPAESAVPVTAAAAATKTKAESKIPSDETLVKFIATASKAQMNDHVRERLENILQFYQEHDRLMPDQRKYVVSVVASNPTENAAPAKTEIEAPVTLESVYAASIVVARKVSGVWEEYPKDTDVPMTILDEEKTIHISSRYMNENKDKVIEVLRGLLQKAAGKTKVPKKGLSFWPLFAYTGARPTLQPQEEAALAWGQLLGLWEVDGENSNVVPVKQAEPVVPAAPAEESIVRPAETLVPASILPHAGELKTVADVSPEALVWGVNVTVETIQKMAKEGSFGTQEPWMGNEVATQKIAEGNRFIVKLIQDTVTQRLPDMSAAAQELVSLRPLGVLSTSAFYDPQALGMEEDERYDRIKKAEEALGTKDLKVLEVLMNAGWEIQTAIATAVLEEFEKESVAGDIVFNHTSWLTSYIDHLRNFSAFYELSDEGQDLIRRTIDSGEAAKAAIYALEGVTGPVLHRVRTPQEIAKTLGWNRSEAREIFSHNWILEKVRVGAPSEFYTFNKAQRGGSEAAVRSVSDKIMDGIYPLLANTVNVIEKLIPAVSRREWVQTVHVEAAKRVLGLVSDSGYAFVLGSDLALAQEKGMLALAKTIFQGSSFAILEKDPTKVADIEKFIAAEGLQERVFVFTKASLAAAKLSKAGVSLKAMISSDELMLAEELEEALNDQPIVMNESMRKRFLNAAGQLFQSLAENIAGQFALARSA